MPGTTRELTNTSDFPRETSPVGSEVIPAVRENGEPVGIPASALVQDGGITAAYIAQTDAKLAEHGKDLPIFVASAAVTGDGTDYAFTLEDNPTAGQIIIFQANVQSVGDSPTITVTVGGTDYTSIIREPDNAVLSYALQGGTTYAVRWGTSASRLMGGRDQDVRSELREEMAQISSSDLNRFEIKTVSDSIKSLLHGDRDRSYETLDFAGDWTGGWAGNSADWVTWAPSVFLKENSVMSTVGFATDNSENVTTFKLKVWSRSASDGSFASGPGQAPSDVLLASYEKPGSEVDQTPFSNFVNVLFNLDELAVEGQHFAVFEFWAEDNLGQRVNIGFRNVAGIDEPETQADQTRRGYYQRSGNLPNGWQPYTGGSPFGRLFCVVRGLENGFDEDWKYSFEAFREEDARSVRQLFAGTTTSKEEHSSGPWASGGTGGFSGWAPTLILDRDRKVDFFRIKIANDEGLGATLRTRVYKLPATTSYGPTALASAKLLLEQEHAVLSVFGASTGFVDFDVPVNGHVFEEGSAILVAAELFDSSGNRAPMGCVAQHHESGVDADLLHGLYILQNREEGAWSTGSVSNNRKPWGRIVTKEPEHDLVDLETIGRAFNFVTKDVKVNAWSGTSWGATGFQLWGVGYSPDAVVRDAVFSPYLLRNAQTEKLTLRVFSRNLNTGDGVADPATSIAPGNAAGDVLVKTIDYDATSFSVETGSTQKHDMTLGLDLEPGKLYMFLVTAFNSSDVQVDLSAGQTDTFANPEPDWQRGWFQTTGASPTAINTISQGGSKGLAYHISGAAVELKSSSDSTEQPFTETVSEQSVLLEEQDGLTVQMPEIEVKRPSGNLTVSAQELTFSAPTSVTVPSEALALIYSNGAATSAPGQRLEYQYVSNVVVTRNSDSAVLVEGVDYAIKEGTGFLYGLQDIANEAVTVSYTGHHHRYDLVHVHPSTGVVAIQQGTNRQIDPEEYKPDLVSGRIELYTAYVMFDSVELVPTHRYRSKRLIDRPGDYSEWLEYCRERLGKTFALLRSQSAVKLIGYGDSITQIGHEGGATQPGYALRANSGRDYINFLSRIPTDTLALIPQFDNTDPDFSDALEGGHVKIGWNWHLRDHLEKHWGSAVEYRNWGQGGTTSANTYNADNDRYGGTHPDRLNAMLADDGDLMVLAFGMNELGSAATYDNIRAIIEAFQDTGGEVIVLPTPQVNEWGLRTTQATWRYTHDELIRAARDTDSAYVPMQFFEGEGHEGAFGLSRKTASTTNLYNHPGPEQLKMIGQAMSKVFV